MKKRKIKRIAVPQMTVANGSTAADSEAIYNLNGFIDLITVTINDNTGNATATLAIIDSGSITAFSLAGVAENATTPIFSRPGPTSDVNLHLPVDGDITVQATPSGDPGASGMTIDVVLYIEEGG